MIAILLVLVVAGSARADILDVPDLSGDVPDETLRADAGVAMTIGRFEAGRDGYISPGFDARVGLGYDRLGVQARAAILMLSPVGSSDDGYATRLGVDARYALWHDRVLERGKHGRPMHMARADFWLGAGVGRESIHAGAGEIDRPDVALELGYSYFTRWPDGGAGHVLRTVGIELDAARAPTGGTDHTVMLTFAFTLGN